MDPHDWTPGNTPAAAFCQHLKTNPNGMGERGLSPRKEPMSRTSEHIVHYTAEQLEAMRRRGEGQTDWSMSQDEAIQRRYANHEAPRPYPGWEDTSTVEILKPKEQIILWLDWDMLTWFRAKGKGCQMFIHAVLRGFTTGHFLPSK
jgi:uncharacterized protein (DUF4415 family)